MTLEEIKLYTIKHRIRAYIYFGVECELELVEARLQMKLHEDDTEETAYQKKIIEKAQKKVEHANKRIDDLQVLVGVEHGA